MVDKQEKTVRQIKHKKLKKRHQEKSDLIQTVAKERIEILFSEADSVFAKNKALANRYVELARRLAMKAKIKMPSKFKRKYCKHCYAYLRPGTNCRVRNNKSMIVHYCLECKKFTKFRIKG